MLTDDELVAIRERNAGVLDDPNLTVRPQDTSQAALVMRNDIRMLLLELRDRPTWEDVVMHDQEILMKLQLAVEERDSLQRAIEYIMELLTDEDFGPTERSKVLRIARLAARGMANAAIQDHTAV